MNWAIQRKKKKTFTVWWLLFYFFFPFRKSALIHMYSADAGGQEWVGNSMRQCCAQCLSNCLTTNSYSQFQIQNLSIFPELISVSPSPHHFPRSPVGEGLTARLSAVRNVQIWKSSWNPLYLLCKIWPRSCFPTANVAPVQLRWGGGGCIWSKRGEGFWRVENFQGALNFHMDLPKEYFCVKIWSFVSRLHSQLYIKAEWQHFFFFLFGQWYNSTLFFFSSLMEILNDKKGQNVKILWYKVN